MRPALGALARYHWGWRCIMVVGRAAGGGFACWLRQARDEGVPEAVAFLLRWISAAPKPSWRACCGRVPCIYGSARLARRAALSLVNGVRSC